MNQLAKVETPSDLAARQLITLDPAEYVAAVYKPFETDLDKAIAESAGVTYDIKTTAGMETAIGLRRRFRDIRISAEKERKTRKAPILEIGKLLDSTYKVFEQTISVYEDRHDAAIKAEEAEKERIRQEKIKAEEARIAVLHNKIGYILNLANEVVGKSSAVIAQAIEFASWIKVDAETFQELENNARLAKEETLQRLEHLREKAASQEAEAERVKQERAQLAKERAEAKAESDRIAAEQAEAQRKIDEVAAELKRQQEAHLRPVLPEKEPEPAPVDGHPVAVEKINIMPEPVKYARPSNGELTVVISEFFGVPFEVAHNWLFGESNVAHR